MTSIAETGYTRAMLNLIGNSCASAYLTKDHENGKFINPFCWNIIDFVSMYNLISNFSKISWESFETRIEKDSSYSLIIDNSVTVNYAHYKYSPTVDKKICENDEGTDFISKNIEDYLIDKYKIRIKRMIDSKIDPTFVIASRNIPLRNNYSADQIVKLLSINTTYTIIAASEFDINADLIDLHSKNREFILLPKSSIKDNGRTLSNRIAKYSSILHYK